MPYHFRLLEVDRNMPGADVGGLLRSGVISLCLAAGVLHVSAASDHRGMAGHVAFFLVVAVAQSALAAAILLARPARWLAVGAAVNLAVALVWVLSRTTGLAVDASSAPEAIGFKDGIATMLEIGAAAGAGLWWLLPDGARRVALPSGRLATTLLGTGVWAVGAAGLFAGHTHSPGHTHASQHADAAAAPNAVEHPHSGDPGHHDDGRTQATASQGTTHHPPNHHHAPEARLTAVRTSTAGGHDHGGDHHHSRDRHHSEAQPVPSRASGHHHAHVAAGPVAQDDSGRESEGHDHSLEGDPGGDHRPSGDDHDHKHDEGGAGNDTGDEDGSASPLEDVLKLLQPR